eukprot:jgi/Tetstr1/459131/TSEL_004579.t1
MKCSAHLKSKNFNNSADNNWQLLHDIMPAGFTWGGMAVPRSHKAMRKFLRVPDTSKYVRHMCPKGCVAFNGAPGKAGGWANLPDQHCPECNADKVPGGGGGSGGEEALVLLDGPGIRKVVVLMAPAHMSCANAADSGVDAPELLVAGIHARSQDALWQTSLPGQKWAASLVVSRVRAAGIEEDEKDMRKRVTRRRPDAKVRKLMAASSTAQPPGVVKTLTDDKKRKRPVKKRRGKKLTVAESEAESVGGADGGGGGGSEIVEAEDALPFRQEGVSGANTHDSAHEAHAAGRSDSNGTRTRIFACISHQGAVGCVKRTSPSRIST